MFVLFFRCSFAKNTLSVKSLFRILHFSIFISCPACCSLEVHKVLALDGQLCEKTQFFVTSCLSPVAHCRQDTWHYPSSWEELQPRAVKEAIKEANLLVAQVCQVANPTMTLFGITLLQPEDKLAFGAWKSFCCQQNPARGDSSQGKSAGHFICNYLLLLLWRLDTKFLKTVKEQRFQFSCLKGPWFPELPVAKLQVSISALGLQDVVCDGQVHWGRLLVLKTRPEMRCRQPNLT